jgi:hypothetical protein
MGSPRSMAAEPTDKAADAGRRSTAETARPVRPMSHEPSKANGKPTGMPKTASESTQTSVSTADPGFSSGVRHRGGPGFPLHYASHRQARRNTAPGFLLSAARLAITSEKHRSFFVRMPRISWAGALSKWMPQWTRFSDGCWPGPRSAEMQSVLMAGAEQGRRAGTGSSSANSSRRASTPRRPKAFTRGVHRPPRARGCVRYTM